MPAPYDSSPAINAAAVTPGNTAGSNYEPCRALYIGTGGDVVPVMEGGGTVTFKNAQSGSIIPVRCVRVNSTNTTATDIVALY